MAMLSLENIHQTMAPLQKPAMTEHRHPDPEPAPAPRHISREVAHDLNNILTVIQVYSERMLSQHRDDPKMRLELQAIFENAKRAAAVVRQASPRAAALIG